MLEAMLTAPRYNVRVVTIYEGDDLYYRFEGSPGSDEFVLYSYSTRLATDDEWAAVKKLLAHVSTQFTGSPNSLSGMSQKLPGMNMLVKHPVTGERMNLWSVVQNLNDHNKWTREQIADWIETLDNVPTFKEPEEVDGNKIRIRNAP